MPSPFRARKPNRPATEAALQDAALALLERNGVLAGLNLREVAEEAGVNRGLVYHYFGTRRDLLRAALRRDVEGRLADFVPGRGLPAAPRYERFLRTSLGHRQAIVLALLLVLDGDDAVKLLPDADGSRARLARDVDDGALPADLDPDGLHAAVAALVYGYAALRERLADDLDLAPDSLDERVAATVRRLVEAVAPDRDPEGVAAERDPEGAPV